MKIYRLIIPISLILISTLIMSTCQKSSDASKNKTKGTGNMSIDKTFFGTTPQGENVDIYTLISNNLTVRIMTYGAIVVSIETPDREGSMDDIVLGYDDLEGYLKVSPYFGAIVGRYGNRIDEGKFKLNGNEYQLSINDGRNHLHGGLKGFDKVVWDAEPIQKDDSVGVRLGYQSPDGEEGYPGNLSITVSYLLTSKNELVVKYHATSDKVTILNPTHHSYFNLAGQGKGDILNHDMQILADNFTPVDQGLIPTGEIRPVEGTPFDFRQPTAIGARIENDNQQLKYGLGYDHNWVLNNQDGSLALAAKVYESSTGRVLEIHTTEPGLQFYSGNFLDGSIKGKKGMAYEHRTGFCLETQHYPDSPNKPDFPSVVLKPGETYNQLTIHRFYSQ